MNKVTVIVTMPKVGEVYRVEENVRPGDTLTVQFDMSLPITLHDKVLGFLHEGKFYRTVPDDT